MDEVGQPARRRAADDGVAWRAPGDGACHARRAAPFERLRRAAAHAADFIAALGHFPTPRSWLAQSAPHDGLTMRCCAPTMPVSYLPTGAEIFASYSGEWVDTYTPYRLPCADIDSARCRRSRRQ